MTARKDLRDLIRSHRVLLKGGAYDGITSSVAADAGFHLISVGGFAVAGSLGMPDVGLATMGEVLHATRSVIRGARGTPVMADIDTGYGNAINLMRTVSEFEAAGVSALQFEDQLTPKSCPYLGRTPLVSVEEAVNKVKAACAARKDPNLLFSARTDAASMEDVIDRGRAYVRAGADMIYIVAKGVIKKPEDLFDLRTALGAPVGFSLTGAENEVLNLDIAEQVGGCMVSFPFLAITTVAHALHENYSHVVKSRSLARMPCARVSLASFEALVGFDEIEQAQRAYLTSSDAIKVTGRMST